MIRVPPRLLTVGLLAVMGAVVHADKAKQTDVGVRAISMGGAFVAVANDATAVTRNPAGLASLQRQEVAFGYADRFSLLSDSYLGYLLPIKDNHALGIDWFREGFDDVDSGLGLKSSQNQIGFAYGYRNSIQRLKPYIGNLAVGVRGKYISQGIDLDEQEVLNASGWGWDMSLLAPLPHGVRLGFAAQDLGGTSLEHNGGTSEEIFPAHYRLGTAYKPIEGLTLAAEIDDHYRVGAEYWFRGILALRGGVKIERDTPESFSDATTPAFGIGVKHRFAQVEYAYETHPELGATHYSSLILSYNPKVVTIKDATIRPSPIFRSLYRHYEEMEFADVVLGNSAPEPIAVTVSLMLPKVMSVPHQEEVLLPPQSTEKYAFNVTFDSDLFNRPEAYFDNFVTPVVRVTYSQNRREQVVEKQLERVYVAGRGKLSWNIPGMAAAFVTPADLAVAGMARGLVQRYNDVLTRKFNRSNMGKAAVLFDAMGVYKIRYQADQKTPFTSISDDKTIFDTVQYPSELLEKPEGVDTKIGDCDDLTVLYASMLENLSIDTAFLEANDPGKGHIYLMFDTGIAPDRAPDHFVSSSEYVVWEGRVWIPVETTMFGFTFADAWRNGVAEYKRLKPRQLVDEVYVQKWLQVYKPAALSPAQISLPEVAALDSLLEKDLQFFDDRVDQIALSSAVSLETPEGAYDAGAAYMRVDHLEKASAMFERVLSMDPDHADALNATGVVLTRQGDFDGALTFYRESLQIAENNGVRMNIALTYYLKGEREKADRLFEEVVATDDSYMELFDFLASVGEAQESYEIGASYLRQLRLDQALQQFDEALKADPKYSDAINAKGVVLTRKGQFNEALSMFEAAAALVPEQLGYRLNVALVHYLKGEHQKADVLYQQVIEQDDSYEGLLDFLASVESVEENFRVATSYLNQGEIDRAIERFDSIIRSAPDMGHAYNSKGVALAKRGDFEAAYELLAKAEELMPEHAGVRLNMAIVRFLQGRRHEAAVIYQQAVEMDDRYEGYLQFIE